ncbi:hypothetical protein AB0I77_27690 [Streptomyces sp. NPDC050619]|uniref:hypothetical protein n=1 Tax=Streptomyces sp. NPDC050619 TaxID=3157214 RepID=UPI00343943E4
MSRCLAKRFAKVRASFARPVVLPSLPVAARASAPVDPGEVGLAQGGAALLAGGDYEVSRWCEGAGPPV